MGISERKEREKEKMRDLILGTANRLFIEQGFEKTSMRNIADAMEYSPATLYLYFRDRDQIFHELQKIAFQAFGEEFRKAVFIKDPYERLRFFGRSYIEFGLRNPGYYELMFILRSPMKSEENKDEWTVGLNSHQILVDTVAECIESGRMPKADPKVASFAMWSLVHGMVSLVIRDRAKMYGEKEIQQILSQALLFVNDGLER